MQGGRCRPRPQRPPPPPPSHATTASLSHLVLPPANSFSCLQKRKKVCKATLRRRGGREAAGKGEGRGALKIDRVGGDGGRGRDGGKERGGKTEVGVRWDRVIFFSFLFSFFPSTDVVLHFSSCSCAVTCVLEWRRAAAKRNSHSPLSLSLRPSLPHTRVAETEEMVSKAAITSEASSAASDRPRY